MSATLVQVSRRWFTVAVVATMLAGSAWAGTKFRIMRTFYGGHDGTYPYGQLTLDGAGNLYGTSFGGGSTKVCSGYGCGTVFRLAVKNGRWSETVLSNFGDLTGQIGQYGPMVLDSAGNLYGTGIATYFGNSQDSYGQLFQLLKNGGSYTESIFHFFFSGSNDRTSLNPDLVSDSAGNLYGSTFGGGIGAGVGFEFSSNGDGTWTETFPYTFGTGKSSYPVGTMIIDQAGNLYGTTAGGGAYGYGSVYKLSQVNGVWSIQSLYDFPPALGNCSFPTPASLVMDAAGNLYGSTQCDGAYGVGSLYKLTPTAGYWTFSLIHSFTGSTDGGYPFGALGIDSSGNIYGSTYTGR